MANIPILLETRHYLVLHKPHGLNVERLTQDFPSVEAWVEDYQRSCGIKKPYTGIVHRLDRPVSGVLIVAKKKMALKILNEQFRRRQVQKQYLARVEGKVLTPKGELIHWIEKDQLRKKAIAHDQAGKNRAESILHYTVLSIGDTTTLLEIHPLTGKFHQIRVQLAKMGHPILGDHTYGASSGYLPDGIALHAQRISFTDPVEALQVIVEAPAGAELIMMQ